VCSLGAQVLRAGADDWGERTITWNNQPLLGAPLDTEPSWSANAFVSFDVTAAVTGSRPVSFVLRHAPGCNVSSDATFHSREAANDPQLVVETDSGPPPTPQCSDGTDNDSDGLTDFPDDPGCTSAQDDSETAPGGLVAVDVADEAGVAESTVSFSANVGDFNRDGREDFLLVRHQRNTSRLYRNDGGRFTEVEAGTFFRKDRHDCAWGDANVDGRPDVYCTRGTSGGTIVKQNELWIQQADGSFVDRAVDFGVTDPLGRGRWATFIDVNHDPFPDLFVGNWFPRQDGQPSPNRLFINNGGNGFASAPQYGVDREVGSDSSLAADYNNDGWEDLLICGKNGIILYRNNNGASFTDVTSSAGLSGGCHEAVLEDMNGDGRLDVVKVSSRSVQIQLQGAAGFGSPVLSRALDAGLELATGDVNEDSAPDLYVLQSRGSVSNHPDLMLVNNGSGTAFSQVAIPQTNQGSGQSVDPIDYNQDGRTDFLVTNGKFTVPGPVQLISFQ
jgi:FG-GAP-like repeat